MIGRIIVKMVSGFNFIKMEINTKACGVETSDMVKELIGGMRMENLEENIQEIGFRIRNMVEELSFTKMGIDMMVTG